MAKHSMHLVALLLGFFLMPTPAHAQEEVIYYHTDAVGSVRAITDNSGAVVGRWDYLPFGELWPADPPHPANPRQFAGKERDSATGLDYFGARYLHPLSGRFTSVDPVMNMEAALADPQRWNRYAYSTNRPFTMFDPDGRDPRLLGAGIGATVFGSWQVYQNVKQGRAWYENVGIEAAKGLVTGLTLGMAAPALATLGAGTIETSAAISAALRSADASRRFEGQVADFLAKQNLLRAFDVRLAGRQIDIIAGKSQQFIVEITTGTGGGKLGQAARQQAATGLDVILYGPNLPDGFVREALRQGVRVARSPEELTKLLF